VLRENEKNEAECSYKKSHVPCSVLVHSSLAGNALELDDELEPCAGCTRVQLKVCSIPVRNSNLKPPLPDFFFFFGICVYIFPIFLFFMRHMTM